MATVSPVAVDSAESAEVDGTVGASFRDELAWHSIDWYQAQRNVRRLQVRIVKATKDGRWGKVHALQRLLTHSFSGKALAARRVTENRGKRTPGVDGETWTTPAQKAQAIRALHTRGYRPHPLRRVYIPKKNGKKRPLGIPTMRCRAMQALYLLALDPIAETLADQHSYGFRPERCTADALVYCHTVLSMKTGATWVLEGDIKACFDGISHEWLLAHVPMDKSLLRKWLKAGFMERGALYPTEAGTPQGGIISPVLANLALDGLERRLHTAFPQSKQGHSPKVNLARYADDFIITGASQDLLEREVKPVVETFLRERGLELSAEKTVISHIEKGFDFLGQTVRRYPSGVTLTTPSKKNVHSFLEKVRDLIERHKTLSPGTLILLLNPLIRGWAEYHRFGASSQTFRFVDHAIHRKLWQWARRRHPGKGARWVKAKYFHASGNRTWVFSGTVASAEEGPYTVRLQRASDVHIQRHTLIQGGANPYDPEWETYFERRLDVKMDRSLSRRRKLLFLWKEQHGHCPVCHQKITQITGWHSHHVIWRSQGGSDCVENRVLLHPTCHMQVHSQGLTVSKPRPHTALERLEPDELETLLSGS